MGLEIIGYYVIFLFLWLGWIRWEIYMGWLLLYGICFINSRMDIFGISLLLDKERWGFFEIIGVDFLEEYL